MPLLTNWIFLAIIAGLASNAFNFMNRYLLKDDEDSTAYTWFYEVTRFLAFAFIAIFISSLGLFGLAAFTAENKRKEIAIRKTIGSPFSKILIMLSKDFTKWVLIANFIAWPTTYFFMNKWLQDFAYRIEISGWMFVLSGGIALLIALATVSFQAIKAAIANPVESLRYE